MESIETTRIYSAMGLLESNQPLMARRPFRSPHHTISNAGLVGGGSPPSPGEISLSHNGVLFLDELPEFDRRTLEVLRQPLEDGQVTISRALASTTFPSDFMLIAALNPCPCGYRNDPRRSCNCPSPKLKDTWRRLADHSWIESTFTSKSLRFRSRSWRRAAKGQPAPRCGSKSSRLARSRQPDSFRRPAPAATHKCRLGSCGNSGPLSDSGMNALKNSVTELGLSARAHDKILRVARTIADLEQSVKRLKSSTCTKPSTFVCSIAISGRSRPANRLAARSQAVPHSILSAGGGAKLNKRASASVKPTACSIARSANHTESLRLDRGPCCRSSEPPQPDSGAAMQARLSQPRSPPRVARREAGTRLTGWRVPWGRVWTAPAAGRAGPATSAKTCRQPP